MIFSFLFPSILTCYPGRKNSRGEQHGLLTSTDIVSNKTDVQTPCSSCNLHNQRHAERTQIRNGISSPTNSSLFCTNRETRKLSGQCFRFVPGKNRTGLTSASAGVSKFFYRNTTTNLGDSSFSFQARLEMEKAGLVPVLLRALARPVFPYFLIRDKIRENTSLFG